MAVGQPIEELPHDARIHLLCKFYQARVQEAHEIMVHELEHQVEEAFLLTEVHRVLFVRNDLLQAYNVFVLELAQNFDFPDSSDGESFFLVFQPHFFQSELLQSL